MKKEGSLDHPIKIGRSRSMVGAARVGWLEVAAREDWADGIWRDPEVGGDGSATEQAP